MATVTRVLLTGGLVLVAAGCANGQTSNSPGSRVPATPTPTTSKKPIGYTGLSYAASAALTPDHRYVPAGHPRINKIDPGSPAEQAGLAVGDEILSVDGIDSNKPGVFGFQAGVHYTVRVRRRGEEREILLIPTLLSP